MTPAISEQARRWRRAHRPAIVVEVRHGRGSVPREDGTRMLVTADQVVGTIGGGHLELQAIAEARRQLRIGSADPAAAGAVSTGAAGRRPDDRPDDRPAFTRHVALGPSLGQCCGGALDLRFTPISSDDPDTWPLPAERFQLQLYGAGHVGRAVVRLLAGVPCRVQWVDEREAEFPAEPSPPHIERVCTEGVEAEVAQAGPGTCFLVMTHSHDVDLAIAEAVLRRADFAWFGLIGSATKRARFEHRLQARGISAQALARMTCPIGLPGIAGKAPEIIAISVVAQLLQQAQR